jgi:uncharacterized protein YlzI (FlbEa/FlbD family)
LAQVGFLQNANNYLRTNVMKFKGLLFLIAFSVFQVQAQTKTTVYYMPPTEEIELIKNYNLALLRLGLEKTVSTHGEFELIVEQNTSFTQRDALRFLKEKKELYVVPTMTDDIRERIFIPVRIPLYKGLFGIRMMITNKSDMQKLQLIGDETQLKSELLTQGSEWPDTQILKANGFKVLELNDKNEMLDAVVNKRAIAYPRSIAEIWEEVAANSTKPLSIFSSMYLYYPTAIYFFVQRTPAGKSLSERLEAGLNIAIADGSFDKVFNKYMGGLIEKADLKNKKMVRLTNPILPAQTPISDKKYWFISN